MRANSTSEMTLTDKFGRPITDLRISITDHCNYKCVYCRTGNEGALYSDLPFADYLRMARVLVGLGIRKIRLTGGEPLLRKGVVGFVRDLAKVRPQGLKPGSLRMPNGTAQAVPSRAVNAGSTGAAHGVDDDSSRACDGVNGNSSQTDDGDSDSDRCCALDIALTTNGHLLADMAQPLKDAGLRRVTVSMDAVSPEKFARITRVPNGYDSVLA